MRAQKERELWKQKRTLQNTKHGLQNKSKNAREELTEFTLQSEIEVKQMERELQSAKD